MVLLAGLASMEPEHATQHDHIFRLQVVGFAAFGLHAQRVSGTHLQLPTPPVGPAGTLANGDRAVGCQYANSAECTETVAPCAQPWR